MSHFHGTWRRSSSRVKVRIRIRIRIRVIGLKSDLGSGVRFCVRAAPSKGKLSEAKTVFCISKYQPEASGLG
jgi:hypothetical protein